DLNALDDAGRLIEHRRARVAAVGVEIRFEKRRLKILFDHGGRPKSDFHRKARGMANHTDRGSHTGETIAADFEGQRPGRGHDAVEPYEHPVVKGVERLPHDLNTGVDLALVE